MDLVFNITNHYSGLSKEDSAKLDQILQIVNINKQNQLTIMQTLADLQAAVAAEDTVIDSAVTLIQGLAAQIAALKPDQAAIDALATDVKAKGDALAAAITANTAPQA